MTGRRIAMWSGPRNISTAMMRSFENRPDTDVVDEPLYGHFLAATGIDHPGRDEVLAEMSTDWREVVARLTAPVPDRRLFYQKHMTHHVTDDVALDWVDELESCFLIRDPTEVIASYRVKRSEGDERDLGYAQQTELFVRVVERTGTIPPVLDARDVLEDPRGVLTALCERLSIPFREEMLCWPAGPRATDGVWARHWYDVVDESTGFGPYRPKTEPLGEEERAIAEKCRPQYERLREHRIVAAG